MNSVTKSCGREQYNIIKTADIQKKAETWGKLNEQPKRGNGAV